MGVICNSVVSLKAMQTCYFVYHWIIINLLIETLPFSPMYIVLQCLMLLKLPFLGRISSDFKGSGC